MDTVENRPQFFMSGNGPATYNRSSGWGRGVQSNVQMSGPKVGYLDNAVAAHFQSNQQPRGASNTLSFQEGHQGGGVLTFSKQRVQGHHAAYSNHSHVPLQDQTVDTCKHHIEARQFGTGLTAAGPAHISQATLEMIGQLESIVRQAEVVVNRFARDVRTAEEKRVVGKLRPRLLRAASASENTVLQAQQYLIQQMDRLQLGRGVEIDPTSGETEANIVGMFLVRLETAARKIYTLGYETPGTEIARSTQLTEALKKNGTHTHASGRNLKHLSASASDATVVGTYGRYQQPQLYVASGAFF